MQDPWVGTIPWRRKWLPTPVFLRIPWTEEPGGLQSMGSQRVRYDWATKLQQTKTPEAGHISCSPKTCKDSDLAGWFLLHQGLGEVIFGIFFRLYHMACGISVPQQWIEPVPSGVKVQSPNHRTTRQVPIGKYLIRDVSSNNFSAYANTPLWSSGPRKVIFLNKQQELSQSNSGIRSFPSLSWPDKAVWREVCYFIPFCVPVCLPSHPRILNRGFGLPPSVLSV